jgi:hypothetical protein
MQLVCFNQGKTAISAVIWQIRKILAKSQLDSY